MEWLQLKNMWHLIDWFESKKLIWSLDKFKHKTVTNGSVRGINTNRCNWSYFWGHLIYLIIWHCGYYIWKENLTFRGIVRTSTGGFKLQTKNRNLNEITNLNFIDWDNNLFFFFDRTKIRFIMVYLFISNGWKMWNVCFMWLIVIYC